LIPDANATNHITFGTSNLRLIALRITFCGLAYADSVCNAKALLFYFCLFWLSLPGAF